MDDTPFLKLLHPEDPNPKRPSPKSAAPPIVSYTDAVVKKAAEVTGAEVVVTGTLEVGPAQAKLSILVFDGQKGIRLGEAQLQLRAIRNR